LLPEGWDHRGELGPDASQKRIYRDKRTYKGGKVVEPLLRLDDCRRIVTRYDGSQPLIVRLAAEIVAVTLREYHVRAVMKRATFGPQ
jgi:hypothetical protein